MRLEIGGKLGGYEIVRELGRGGRAAIYEALQPELGRSVALKVLLPENRSPQDLERLRREAHVLARLNHENIIAVYDIDAEGHDPYIAMELLGGETLAERLTREPPGMDEAFAVAAGIAGAVDAAHAQGIVHRDIRPANVLLARDGTPKLTGFSLALHAEPGADVMLGAASVGAAPYQAPEVAEGARADAGSDLYSLGATLGEMLRGRTPHGESSKGAVAVPDAVGALLDRMLSTDPNERPGAAEVRDALAAVEA